MTKPCTEAAAKTWAQLVRVEQSLLASVEAELKATGFPPLAWYDALLELSRTPGGYMRPLDLERAMLLPQYSTSRLIDRLVKAGLVIRKVCPIDGRGQFVEITAAGKKLRQKMWPSYAAAIERHVGAKLSREDVAKLGDLLGKLV
jgi:DNA-binding MarR family transcriptional regulator